MPTIDRGTHRISYEIDGPEGAPPILLIMGLGLSSRAWHTLPSRLKQSFRVITFDNAGTGRSTAPRSISVKQMADDAAAVLDAAGVDSCVAFGISMGGMIALELVLRHAQRVRTLVLGCTYGGYWDSEKPTLTTFAMLTLAALLPGRVPTERLAGFLTTEAYYQSDREGFLAWLTNAEAAGPLTALRQLRAIASHSTHDRLAQIAVPTLILSGDSDRLVPVANSRRLAVEIRGAQLIEFAGVGHCFPVERPDDVVRALVEFTATR